MSFAHNDTLPEPPAPWPGKIVLASGSPRRRELLGLIVPEFDIAQSRPVDESYDPTLPAERVPEVLSRKKSEAYADLLVGDTLLITADTLVICEGKILGKPRDAANATEMLHLLSGRTHTVVTGVTLAQGQRRHSFAETTQVHFGNLSDDDIREYVERFRPFDKAGAYGIQEWIGCIGIRGIDGCFYNVMGLPLHSLYAAIRAFTARP